MKDIEKRVRGLVAKHDGSWAALFAELEAHDATKAEFEAFRRDVSEACNEAWDLDNFGREQVKKHLSRFILPEPVDPLLIQARKIVAEVARHIGNPEFADLVEAGNRDTNAAVLAAKRGLIITEQQP